MVQYNFFLWYATKPLLEQKGEGIDGVFKGSSGLGQTTVGSITAECCVCVCVVWPLSVVCVCVCVQYDRWVLRVCVCEVWPAIIVAYFRKLWQFDLSLIVSRFNSLSLCLSFYLLCAKIFGASTKGPPHTQTL